MTSIILQFGYFGFVFLGDGVLVIWEKYGLQYMNSART